MGLGNCIRALWECHQGGPWDQGPGVPQSWLGRVEGLLAPSLGQSAGSRVRGFGQRHDPHSGPPPRWT